MKKYLYLIWIISIPIIGLGQVVNIENLLNIKPLMVKQFDARIGKPQTIFLKMDFNSAKIINPEIVNFISGQEILKIELYYTAFQVSDHFSQPKLNKERLLNLKQILPDVFQQSSIKWEFKGQNDCLNEEIAKTYFHGFVITYKFKPKSETATSEIVSIKAVTTSDSLGYDSVYTIYQTRVKKKRYKTGKYIPVLKSKSERGVLYSSKSLLKRKPQYLVRLDTIRKGVQVHKFVKNKGAMSFVKRNLRDTTIFAVLRRHEAWNEMAFICDVTGSMSAYTTQLLVWYKLNCIGSKVQYFTFFNDGDNKPERKKKIGNIGGIYNIEAGNYEAVEKMIEHAMLAGGGGDAPENNCEALLETIKKQPNAKEYVMIADNFANVKDIELLTQINKPVHIIICGSNNFMINTDYLNLARATHGSIHSIEQDIENLMKVNEGETISFDHKQYVLRDGKFYQLTEL